VWRWRWYSVTTALFVAEDGLGIYFGGSAGWDPAGDEGYGG
jgi:hypothetical protein